MRILSVARYYDVFLRHWYASHPGVARAPFAEQLRSLLRARFATSDSYSRSFRRLGHESAELVVNAVPLQARWAIERRVPLRLAEQAQVHAVAAGLGWLPARFARPWLSRVFVEQVRAARPDVLFVQDIGWLAPATIRALRGSVRLIVAVHASALASGDAAAGFDVVVSSLPNLVTHFTATGVRSAYVPLAFDPEILGELTAITQSYDISHVGGYGGIHLERDRFLEEVARSIDVEFFGHGHAELPAQSPIRRRYRGEAWGLDMFAIRAASKITITKHITSVAGPFANNQTMFEATGVGSVLVVDRKENLRDLFAPGAEVVAYDSAADCIDKLRYLLDHDNERRRIARAGQKKTLADHTYAARADQFADLFATCLGGRAS